LSFSVNAVNDRACDILKLPLIEGFGAWRPVYPFSLSGVVSALLIWGRNHYDRVAFGAFLTPIGHKNNTIIKVPGGYSFGDYWRMGLPLGILVLVALVPTILYFWPL